MALSFLDTPIELEKTMPVIARVRVRVRVRGSPGPTAPRDHWRTLSGLLEPFDAPPRLRHSRYLCSKKKKKAYVEGIWPYGRGLFAAGAGAAIIVLSRAPVVLAERLAPMKQ